MPEQEALNTMSRRKIDWWIYTVPILLAITVFFHLSLFVSPGKLRLLIYYLGPLLVSMLAILFFIIGLIRSLLKRPFFSKWRIAGFLGLLLFPAAYMLRIEQSGNFLSAYPSSHAHKKSSVVFRLPLDTPITVVWGGDKVATNYHVIAPDQRWAYDLLVMKNGKSFAGDSTKLENYFCYALPVLAPASGQVVQVFDSLPDMKIGAKTDELDPPHGNHIAIQVAQNEFLLLCHLKPKSILVKKGDRVQQGQPVALLGNSGNTSEPHLHIHLQDTDELSFGEGIPLYFSHYTVNGKTVGMGMPTGGFDDNGNFIGQVVQNLKK